MNIHRAKKIFKSWQLTVALLLIVSLDMSTFGINTDFSSGVKKVIIDAGHGGRDPGNLGTGRYKTKEKHIALKVALQAGQLIEENIEGVEVIYTRKSDNFLELRERTTIANNQDADLFISVHCDAFTSSSAKGSSSYVMGKNHGDENLRVAQSENSVIFLEDNYEENYEGFDPSRPETYIALTLYQNHFQYQSISLAQKIQDEFSGSAKRKDRGVKQQPLWVTSRAAMPAVLVELGFLTNSEEEDFLNSNEGQKKMAESIYSAVAQYKQEVDQLQNTNAIEEANRIKEEERVAQEEEAQKPKIEFRVQVRTSSKDIPLNDPFFKGQQDVGVYKSGQNFKYTVGHYLIYEDARNQAVELRGMGFEGAFVVAFRDDERIDITEARKASE